MSIQSPSLDRLTKIEKVKILEFQQARSALFFFIKIVAIAPRKFYFLYLSDAAIADRICPR